MKPALELPSASKKRQSGVSPSKKSSAKKPKTKAKPSGKTDIRGFLGGSASKSLPFPVKLQLSEKSKVPAKSSAHAAQDHPVSTGTSVGLIAAENAVSPAYAHLATAFDQLAATSSRLAKDAILVDLFLTLLRDHNACE
jgi:hypothetical protein